MIGITNLCDTKWQGVVYVSLKANEQFCRKPKLTIAMSKSSLVNNKTLIRRKFVKQDE